MGKILFKIIFSLFLCSSFFANAQNQNDTQWQSWTQSNCYSKISFRIKDMGQQGETYHWQLQFRNLYPTMISFNYFFSDDQFTTDRIFKRKLLSSGETCRPIDIYFQKNAVFVFIEKMSFSPYPDDIEPCDKEIDNTNS